MKSIADKLGEIVRQNAFVQIPVVLKEHREGILRYYAGYDTGEQLRKMDEHLASCLADKISYCLSRKEIPSIKDAKKILFDIRFLTDMPFIERGELISSIIGKALGKGKPVEVATQPPVSAAKKVQYKKQFYNKVYADNIDLFVNTNFSQIGKMGGKVVIRRDGKIKTEVLATRIHNIIIGSKGVTVSSDVVQLCCNNNILISYHDYLGKPYASISPSAAPLSSVSLAQTEALADNKGKVIAKSLIFAKIKNQIATIKFFIKNKKLEANEQQFFDTEIEEMDKLADSVMAVKTETDYDVLRDKVFGFEGSAAVSYWKLIRTLIPEDLQFEKREHQDAENPVNILLNYGYGILYSRILNAVTVAGLNPNISFLHKEQKNKPTLIFDVIEEYRAPVVDRTVIAFLTKRTKLQITGKQLSDDTRKKIVEKVLRRINSEITYRGERMTMADVMLAQVKEMMEYLKEEKKQFKPFLAKW